MTTEKLVHIIDDEEAIRRSAGFMLKTSGFRISAWPSGAEFLRQVRHVEPGCILLDIRMPEMDGLEVQRALAGLGVTMPVVMLTGHGDISIAVQAMKGGAVDFLEKPFEKATLLEALDTAFRKMDAAGAHALHVGEAQKVLAVLTRREREVLEGLAQGLPNKAIAHDLGISPRTVEVHRANLMSKLDVHSLSDALRIAFAAGLGS